MNKYVIKIKNKYLLSSAGSNSEGPILDLVPDIENAFKFDFESSKIEAHKLLNLNYDVETIKLSQEEENIKKYFIIIEEKYFLNFNYIENVPILADSYCGGRLFTEQEALIKIEELKLSGYSAKLSEPHLFWIDKNKMSVEEAITKKTILTLSIKNLINTFEYSTNLRVRSMHMDRPQQPKEKDDFSINIEILI